MDAESKQKILGAFVVGIAIVGGAYTVANFGETRVAQPATVVEATPPARVAIEVSDADGNGVEDWRDQFFLNNGTVEASQFATSSYTPPDTITGNIGTELIREFFENRIYGAPTSSDEQLVKRVVESLETETSGTLYDTQDILIITNYEKDDLLAYANVMGSELATSSLAIDESSVEILNDIVVRGREERVDDLRELANYYKTLTESALRTPVPIIFAKEHLDLINTYHAISIDIEAMTNVTSDPAVTMMRLRRYDDNSLGLQLALRNMHFSLQDNDVLLSDNDPGLVFSLFAPRQRI